MWNFNNLKPQDKTQYKQILDCIKEYKQEIQDLGIFNHYKNFEALIRKNFIQYNGDTKLLIMQLLRNVFSCYNRTGLKCSFPLTSIKLCDKDEDRGLMQNYHTIQSRMQVLEKEGVIKRYKTNKYFVVVFLVDISKPFERKTKKYFKQKEITTTPLINELKAFTKEEEINLNKEEESFKEQINEQLDLIDVADNDKERFKEMFWEFCDSREGSKGQRIKKKSQLAITRKTGPLDMLQNAKRNNHDPYLALENCLNRGYENIGYYQYSDLKFLNKKQELVKYGISSDDDLINDFSNLANEFKEGKIKTIEEFVNKSKIGQATQIGSYIKTMSKHRGEKLAKIHIKKQEINETSREKEQINRIINYCKNFKNDKINYQYVMMNILDNDKGEKVYMLLVKHFVNKINNKYPQDTQRGVDFESNCFSMLRIAQDNKIDYIPLIYAYYVFLNMPDDWKDRTNDSDLVDKIVNQSFLERFIKEEVVKPITSEDYMDGCWRKVLKGIKFYGFYTNGENNAETKEEKLFNYICGKLVNCYKEKVVNVVKFRSLTTLTINKENKSIELKSSLDLNNEEYNYLIKRFNSIVNDCFKQKISVIIK